MRYILLFFSPRLSPPRLSSPCLSSLRLSVSRHRLVLHRYVGDWLIGCLHHFKSTEFTLDDAQVRLKFKGDCFISFGRRPG